MPLQNAIDLPTNAVNPKLTNVNFQSLPIVSASTGGTAAITQGTVNVWSYPQYGAYFECWNAVAPTNIVPTMGTTSGINLSGMTGAAAKINEITEGNSAAGKSVFLARTSAPFYVQATFNIATLANVTDLLIGFRKIQGYQVALASYTDFASIGVHSTTGQVQLQTNLASGGVVTTNTTNSAVAGTNFTVRVNVDASGNATYLLNGVAPTTVVAYQFAATNVVPFIWYNTVTANTEADLISYSCGLQ